MDELSAVLDAHRGRDAFVLRCEMQPPWSVRIADQAAVGLIVMLRGECFLTRAGEPPVRLAAGDVAVAKGTTVYDLGDDPRTPPSVVIEPGQRCRTLDGADVSDVMTLGTRSWGNAREGSCAFLTGTYELSSQVSGRLLRSVPDLVVLEAPQCDPALLGLLAQEIGRDLPGQDVLLDRYVDLVLVCALRHWFARPESDPPLWWRAQSDTLVGQVLSLMHEQPGRAWTLDNIAAQVGYSRATVARRFAELVGQPAMSYLAEWRMTMAADLLLGSDDTVETVGRCVGYANPFAFSSAFKRFHGVSPRAFRARVA